MTLKRTVKDLDEVDEKYHDLYEERNGEFVLAIEDDGSRAKLNEFRQQNIDLKKRLDKIEERYRDVDPDEYKKAQDAAAKLQDLEERELLKQGRIDEILARRTAQMREGYETKLSAKTSAYDDLLKKHGDTSGKLKGHLIEAGLRSELAKAGYRLRGESAMTDLLARAVSTWDINEDGELHPGLDGKTIFGADGDPLKMAGWLQGQAEKAGHLFEPQQGGGADGGSETTKTAGGKTVISSNDPEAFGANIEGILSGDVEVQ